MLTARWKSIAQGCAYCASIYGPHEKSVMHEYPDAVAIPLSDAQVKFTLPDGKSEVSQMKTGNLRASISRKTSATKAVQAALFCCAPSC
jgi:hypothetical protein